MLKWYNGLTNVNIIIVTKTCTLSTEKMIKFLLLTLCVLSSPLTVCVLEVDMTIKLAAAPMP